MPGTTRRARRAVPRSEPSRSRPGDETAAEPQDAGAQAPDRILTAAQNLFATRGLGTSLREITESARVNIAAVNYHFGSKEQLTEILFDRLSRAVNAGRLAELDAVLDAAARDGRPPALDAIILAFVRPYLEPTETGRLLARLILQHRIEPSKLTQQIIRTHFDPMARRFIEALRLALPGRSAPTFAWRYTFMVSAVVLTVTDGDQGDRLLRLSEGSADPRDTAELRVALLAFLHGGMTAPERLATHGRGPVRRRRKP